MKIEIALLDVAYNQHIKELEKFQTKSRGC